MSRLWEFDEFGEPWLENGRKGNPPLLIVNRKKSSKKGKKMAVRRRKKTYRVKTTHRRGRKHTSRRRRRNPWPMAGTVVAANPRRRKVHRRGRKARHNRRRRSYRRNPALLGISLPPLQSVIYVGAGFVVTPIVEGFITKFLPLSLTGNTVGKYAARIASVLGLSFVAKMVLGSSEAKMVAVGGGAYVLTTALNEFAPNLLGGGMPQVIPAAPTMQAYRQASLGAYANSTRRGLSAPAWGARNTVASASAGGMNVVSQRFRRFQ